MRTATLRALLCLVLVAVAVTPGLASLIFDVTIDTSSVDGQAGEINLVLLPGGFSPDPLTVTITNFSLGGGTFESFPDRCFNDPDCPVTGDLETDPQVVFTYDPGNPPVPIIDYFQLVTWGTQVSFRVTLSGAAISSPGQSSLTYFDIYLLDGDTGDSLFTSTGADPQIGIEVDNSGVAIQNFTDGEADVTAVPEAGTWAMAALGIVFLMLGRKRWSR